MDKIKRYIIDKWDETLRFSQKDEGSRIALPYPYNVPTINNYFNEMYYWDTYFTNKGLLLSGRVAQAKNNCENIAYMIEKFGYMPNGNRTYYLGRSQPPFFALMVWDIYQVFPDKTWLKKMSVTQEKELQFWYKYRSTQSGLQRYGVDNDDEWCKKFFKQIQPRLDIPEPDDLVYAGKRYGAEAESGWDFCARFDGDCPQFNPVDLNSLLYIAERLLVQTYGELGTDGGEKYDKAATERAEKINALCFEESKGVYLDYRYDGKKSRGIASAAGFFPFFAKIVPLERINAAKNLLDILELPWGISVAEEVDTPFQWGYPNAWAPMQLIAVVGLANYGLMDEAKRIAKKYVELVRVNFEKTGGIWEKYNAKTGGVDAVSENKMPEMMGWTAGAYLYCLNFLEQYA